MKPSMPTRSATCSPSYQRLNSASSAGAMSMKVISMPLPRRLMALLPFRNQPGLGRRGGLPLGERGQRQQRLGVGFGGRRQLDAGAGQPDRLGREHGVRDREMPEQQRAVAAEARAAVAPDLGHA